jgi:hypothetical protein
MGKLVNRSQQTKRKIRAKVEAGFHFAVVRGAELFEARLGTLYPPASKPGQYPHKRTGNLQGAVGWYVEMQANLEPSGVRAKFGIRRDAPIINGAKKPAWTYFRHLLKSGRLGPADIFRDNRAELERAFFEGSNLI